MKINKISLKNYRNHIDTTIEFKSGINLLLGKNGAGKSSIFEALGIALFDVEPRDNNLKNAVTKEEKTATIVVEFSGNDSVDYIVERKVGSQSRYILKELNGNIISERKNNVLEKIGELAGINGTNAKDIFKNVISAYQNDLVNIFNLTPSSRKELFNKIFDTEIYEKIFSSLLQVENEYNKKILADKEKVNLLDEQLKNYVNIEKDISNIKQIIFEIEKTKKTLEEKKDNLEHERKSIQTKLEELKTLKNTLNSEKEKVEILRKNKDNIEKQILESQKALEIVKKTENGYNEYIKIELELNSLYKTERELRNKEKELKNLQEEKNKKINEKNLLDVEIKNIEEKLEEYNVSLNQINDENSKLKSSLKEKLDELNNTIILEKNILEEIKKFEYDYEKYREFERILKELDNNILEEDNLKKIISEKMKELNNYQNSLENTINKLEEKKKLEFMLNELKLKIDNFIKSKTQLQDGICPILNEKCLNLEEKGGSTNYFDLNINNLQSEKKELEEKIISLGNLDSYKKELENTINDFKVTIETIKNKLLDIESNKKLKSEILLEKNKIEKQYNNLSEKKIEYEKKKNEIISLKGKIENNLENIKESINKNNIRIKELEGNILSYRKKREINILKKEKITSEINILSSKEKDLSKVLLDIENMENLINEKEKIKVYFKEDYELYMKNNDLASKLNDYKFNLEQINNEIIIISNNINDLSEKINKYEDLDVLKNKLSNVELEINEVYKKINETFSKLSEYKNELKNLNILFDEKKEKEKQKKIFELNLKKNELKLNLTKDFRENIKSMGKYVSSEFTKIISSHATENYRKMTGKNETIVWDSERDYLVTLKDPLKGEREFSILSGGEQVSVAISIRTALANFLSKANFYILDEPTINLDEERKNMLAENLNNMLNEIEQAFIVTHDGTFSEMAENIIEL